jgi:glutamate-ammonia-ligase adenylyltransferase
MEMDVRIGERLARLRAGSKTLASFLEVDERSAELVSVDVLPGEDEFGAIMRTALERGGAPELRLEKRRRLLQIAALDLGGLIDLTEVGRALADLAGASLDAGLIAAGAPEDLCVIGMGKLGGRELNYVSDIDVMFVARGDIDVATKGASSLLSILGDFSPQGQAYRIDVDLRPEGRSGALVRSLDGYLEYYRRWADEWEHQALIKARPVAGDVELGTELVAGVAQFVYPDEVTAERVANIRAMKERVENHAAETARRGHSVAGDDVKLGPGGIRDIEFSVQLLQLVHGGSDTSVRSAGTLRSLSSLTDGGYIAEEDGAGLAVAYEWLRTVEHRLQLWQERKVHHLPQAEADRARVARAMGFKDTPAAGAGKSFSQRHKAVLVDVRGRFEKLFYRPMIESLADGAAHRLSGEALSERLRVLGFRDVARATRTLAELVGGTSRRAKVLRVLSPAMLRWLARSPQPDTGLFAFLRLSEALGNRIDALGALRDNPPGLSFLAGVLGSGRILGEILVHVPEEISLIAEGPGGTKHRTTSTDRDGLVREARASLSWREVERRYDGLRRFKRRAMLEVALDDIGGRAREPEVGARLSHIADACLQAAVDEVAFPLAVIGMGKLGGRELNYSSDVDVMFVHDGDPHEAEKAAERLLASIGEVTPEGQAFRIDPSIRPEGKSGPLARSIGACVEYYERWGQTWEHQALIKARPAAGDADVGDRFIAATRRYSFPDVLGDEALREIRHLKARMERERIPRGTEPRRNFKLGPGGLSDIEFAIQIIQMRHGSSIEELRAGGTLEALMAARDAELLDLTEAELLSDGYVFLSRLRNRLFLLVGRPVDALPDRPERMEALGISLGFGSQPRQELEEAYLRTTRRVRRVTEPIIYG